MIRPEDVTDAMAEAAWGAYVAERWASPRVRLIYAIAAAINASGCVLVPRQVLEAFVREIPDGDDGDGNAPGHCHEVPGIWDDDNRPEIAGKPCAWCATWNAMKALLAAADPREQALDRMAENAQELGLYDEGKEKGDE